VPPAIEPDCDGLGVRESAGADAVEGNRENPVALRVVDVPGRGQAAHHPQYVVEAHIRACVAGLLRVVEQWRAPAACLPSLF
jgi:hypothetical protein